MTALRMLNALFRCSSTQTVFHWSLLWTLSLVPSVARWLDSGQMIGPASFIFYLKLVEFPWLCSGSSSRWNVHSHFIFIILVDGSSFYIWCGAFGVTGSAFWPPNTVCIMASKRSISRVSSTLARTDFPAPQVAVISDQLESANDDFQTVVKLIKLT